MKKFSLFVLPLFLLSLFLNGCSPQTGTFINDNSQQSSNGQVTINPPLPTPQPSPAPAPKPQENASGIRGTATIGPSCPVERIPPDPNCADKPYAGSFSISTESGAVVKTFETASDGSFDVAVPAGTYVISLAQGKVYPRLSPTTVTVKEGQFTSIHLELDSGVR